MSDKLVEIEIIDLAFDGKAVGHLDGKVVFLKGGLPGEIVLAEITQQKRRFNNGIVREIIKRSPKRIDAICPHFDICGGCTWQDLSYDDQLAYKQKQVKDCLERIGALENIKINPIVGSKEIFNYRNKMEYSFHVHEEKGFTLGLHHRGAFDKIFDLNECHISQKTDGAIVSWVRDYVKTNEIPVYDVFEHHGYVRFLMLRQAKQTDGLMVNIVTNFGEFPERDKFVSELTNAFPQITTIVHNQNGQKSNISTGEIEDIIYGPGYIEEKLFGLTFKIRANSFFQTNSLQTETLYQIGFDMLDPQPDDKILDLYCGAGSIGLLLAQKVSEVVGVELVPDAVASARENAMINNINNAAFFEGDVKKFLIEHGDKQDYFDIIVIDPPRAGLNPKAIKHLLHLNAKKIMYISCNPATFARDAEKLVQGGYELPQLTPVDMFPHTMHIELATTFFKN